MQKFKKISIDSKEELAPYFRSRDIISCEYHFSTLFIWGDYLNVQYAIEDNYVMLTQRNGNRFYSLMPLCKKEYFHQAFEATREYFHEFNSPFSMYGIDSEFLQFIKDDYPDQYIIQSNRDYYDYIYDAEKLRTLRGKKYSKKRNHINAFLKEHGDCFYYKRLDTSHKEEICEFLKKWSNDKEDSKTLDVEFHSICKVMDFAESLDVKIGGIYLDNQLEAFSIGSLVNKGTEAIIHIEKANAEIRGMYQLINQQFLKEEFPNVKIVNREEDLGIEGLRKSKLSYYPIQLLKKYIIREK